MARSDEPEDPFYSTPAHSRGGIQPRSGGEGKRPLEGASQTNRSGSRLITIPTNSGSTADQSFLNICSTPREAGEDAEVLSVLLDMDLPDELVNDANYNSAKFDVVAVLEWGIGGVPFKAEVDWSTLGNAISVKASNLRISAILGPVTAVLQPDVEVLLKTAISYGSPAIAGVSSPARRTFNLGGAAAGGNVLAAGATSSTIEIPRWAVGVTVVDAGTFPGILASAPDYTLKLSENQDLSTLSAQYKCVSRDNLARHEEGQFPIPNKARYAALVNNSLMDMKSPKLIFNLAI